MKKQTGIRITLLLAAITLAGATGSVRADDTVPNPSATMDATTQTAPEAAPMAAPDQDSWRFGATLPLWAPQIDGNVTLFGRTKDVNVSFNTLRQHLDTSLGIALSAQKGKFGLFTSVGYMKFSGNDGASAAGLKFLMYNAGASYLLLKTDGEHPFILAGTAGIRYWYASTWLTIPAVPFKGTKTWDIVDPVIGLRASQYLTPKFHLDFTGDIGGFDINNDTDFTWSAAGMATYDFAKWFSLSAGYSAVAIDESKGGGASKMGVNFIFNGVAAALTFKF